jgi:hypothetical protein
MRLSNPSESLGNVEKSDKYRPHASKVRELLDPVSLAKLKGMR